MTYKNHFHVIFSGVSRSVSNMFGRQSVHPNGERKFDKIFTKLIYVHIFIICSYFLILDKGKIWKGVQDLQSTFYSFPMVPRRKNAFQEDRNLPDLLSTEKRLSNVSLRFGVRAAYSSQRPSPTYQGRPSEVGRQQRILYPKYRWRCKVFAF